MKNLIFLFLIIFLAMQLVSAEDSTEIIQLDDSHIDVTDSTFNKDINLENFSSSNELSNNAVTHLITEDSYFDYFDNQGFIKEDSGINDGDVLNIGNVSDKFFIISKALNITSNSNDILTNCQFEICGDKDTLSGINIYGLNIENIDLSPFYIEYVEYCNFFNNNIKVSSSLEMEDDTIEIFGIDTWFLYNSNMINNNFTISGLCKIYGINLLNCENITVKDNNIIVVGLERGLSWLIEGLVRYSALSLAIQDSKYVNVLNNTINSSVCGDVPSYIDSKYSTTQNILVFNSKNTLIDSNKIYTKGNYYIYGIHLEGMHTNSSMNNNFTNNYIYSESIYYTNGIQVAVGCSYSYIFNNTIICNSTNITYGINLLKMGAGDGLSFNNDVINNTIFCYSYFNQGIQLYNSENNNIEGNSIYTNGSVSLGISLGADSYNNNITYNEIIAVGDNNQTIGLDYVDDIELENTGIKLKTRGDIGTSNNYIAHNNIKTSGDYAVILAGNDNKVIDNVLVSLNKDSDDSVDDNGFGSIISNNTDYINNTIPHITIDNESDDSSDDNDLSIPNIFNPDIFNDPTDIINDDSFINTIISNNTIENVNLFSYSINSLENDVQKTPSIGLENNQNPQGKSYELKKQESSSIRKSIINEEITKLVGFLFLIVLISFLIVIYYKKMLQKDR